VIANAPVVLFTLDRAGIVTLSEGKGLARLGLTPGEVVGQHFFQTLRTHGEDPMPYRGYLERGLAGEPVAWEGSIRDATFECRLTPIRDGRGTILGVLGLAIDVTERKQAEAARLGLERKLLATDKLESLGVLAGGIAHDFNNLLVSVLGNASLAVTEIPPGSPALARLEKIDLAARRGADLTRQLLAYAGHGSATLEAVDVNGLVEEMLGLVGVSVDGRSALRFLPGPGLPPLEADATQLRQVVLNLLTNAGEAIGEAGGTITVRTGLTYLDEHDLRATQHDEDAAPGAYVWIEVADTGAGMDPATRERIFDPFFSTKFAGRGLGLATVLGIVRGHRGAVAVDSVPGQGTTFRVLLPCASNITRPAHDEAPAEPHGPEPEGRTILLVDDEEDVRAVTQHMLERLGCRVLLAGDGREGVDVFRTNARMIDAVLVDLTLPRLSGEQAVSEMRRIRPDARVILMSGYNDERTTRRLLEEGSAEFLRKPFSVADLRSTMERALT
jgi:PAS domain S-box-containing protein